MPRGTQSTQEPRVKRIEWFFKKLYLNALTLARYGKLRPDRARLVRSQRMVHIDPADPCAWKKQVTDPLRGVYPRNQRFWREVCAALSPDIALDIGLNYGECAFAPDYSPRTQVFGFEANAALKPFLDRTLAEHPQRQQIHLVFGLVGDQPGKSVEFFVDRAWSGGSTAAGPGQGRDIRDFEKRSVPTVSVDSVLASTDGRDAHPTCVVFKIDVEGYEARVLAGMKETIARTPDLLGLIEFDAAMLSRAGESVEEYWRFLQDTFHIHAFLRNDDLIDVRGWPVEQLRPFFKPDHFHTDLLLVKSAAGSAVWRYLETWPRKEPRMK